LSYYFVLIISVQKYEKFINGQKGLLVLFEKIISIFAEYFKTKTI